MLTNPIKRMLCSSALFLSSSTICHLSPFLATCLLSLHLPHLSSHPSLNLTENLRRTNMLSFLKANLALSSSPSPSASAATSNHISPLFTFTVSFPQSCLHLSPRPLIKLSPIVSQIPVYVPRRATPVSPALFVSLCCHFLPPAMTAHHSCTL